MRFSLNVERRFVVLAITILAIAILAGIAAVPRAEAFQVAIAPMRYELQLDNKPITRALKLINQGNQDITVRLRAANFDLDENNQVREIAPRKDSLDQWLILRPLKLTIKAGESRTVRFAIRPLSRPKPGEHRAMIFVERDDAGHRKDGKLNVNFRFGVSIYANVGAVDRRAKLHAVAPGSASIDLDVQSTGTAHARLVGTYGVWPAAKYPGRVVAAASIAASEFNRSKTHKPKGAAAASVLPSLPVYPGRRRVIKAAFETALAPGSYKALVIGHVGTLPIERVVDFRVGQSASQTAARSAKRSARQNARPAPAQNAARTGARTTGVRPALRRTTSQ